MIDKKEKLIFVIGHVANAGTKIIIDEKKKELLSYFSIPFIENAKRKILEEEEIISKIIDNKNIEKVFFTTHISTIDKGGIYTALWDMSKKERTGMDFSQKDIPIYQETIEICNFFDILPYRLYTKNCYIVFEDKEWLDKIKEKYKDISIKCIGKLYNKKECARIDGDTKAYLTKDYKDELNKIVSIKLPIRS